MVEFNSIVLIGVIIVLTVWGTSFYHRRKQEYKNEIMRLDQLISDTTEYLRQERHNIHTRIDTEILEVNRRIDEARQELIEKSAKVIKSVKSR